MDNDVEINDNDNSNFNKRSPIPDNCSSEIDGIESLRICFMQRYDSCPALYVGSLRNACYTALNSPIINERCPVLVYIHNDRSEFCNIFCWSVFCSTIIIDYLLDKYIVWPWDITYESNRNTLINIWKEIFSNQLCIEQCPMLIGIMRRSTRENNLSLTSEYEFRVLVKGATVIRTKEIFNPKSVLDELSMFKEECDDNEHILSSKLITKTGLCEKDIVEICKYLSLNDAVNAFSTDILYFLRKSKARVHITELSDAFINIINRKINSEQIASLRLNTDQFQYEMTFSFLSIFNKIISLTLVNLQLLEQISEYIIHFPNLICISLWYNNEIGFNVFNNMFNYLPKSIKRFEIHCSGVLCTHYDLDEFNMYYIPNYSVKYFLLDISRFPLVSTNQCFQYLSIMFFYDNN